MEKFFRNNLSVLLPAAAVAIAALLLWYAVHAALFVAGASKSAAGNDLINDGEIATFDLAGADAVKKMRGR